MLLVCFWSLVFFSSLGPLYMAMYLRPAQAVFQPAAFPTGKPPKHIPVYQGRYYDRGGAAQPGHLLETSPPLGNGITRQSFRMFPRWILWKPLLLPGNV